MLLQNFAEFSYLPFLLAFFLFYFYHFGKLLLVHFMLLLTGAIFIRQKAKVCCQSELLLFGCNLLLVPLDYRFYAPPTTSLPLCCSLSLLVICTKYSRPGSKCGRTSHPSSSYYTAPLSSQLFLLHSEFHVHISSQIQ